VGTTAFTLQRPIEPRETSRGGFAVQLWYPALPSNNRAPYAIEPRDVKARLYRRLVHTHSARDAAPVLSGCPVVVYAPAWGGERAENTALAEELASQGYVVAAFDDLTRDSPALSRFSNGPDLRSERAFRATIQLAKERLAYVSARASAVLDFLTTLDEGAGDGRLSGRMDLQRVGILGYSFGGAVALATCCRDQRFRAAMNLDGMLFGAGDAYDGRTPYLLVSDATPDPTPEQLSSNDVAVRCMSELIVADGAEQRVALRRGGHQIRLPDTVHESFTDVPLYAPLKRFRAGWNNPPRLTAALRNYALEFFDRMRHAQPSRVPTGAMP
jgi:dienelactone hydrolase